MSSATQKWMSALSDDSLGLNTNASCVSLDSVVAGDDRDKKLVLADLGTTRVNLTLKVFKGITKIHELVLADPPIALVTFHNEQTATPAIGVCCGASFYVYKGMKPFYQYSVPPTPLHDVEKTAWEKLRAGELSADDMYQVLALLKQEVGMGRLSPHTQKVLTSSSADRRMVVTQLSSKDPINRSPITCCATLKRTVETSSMVDVLCLGCENGAVHIIDTAAFQALQTTILPSPPVFMITTGQWDVEPRVYVSTRDGHIYAVGREGTGTRFSLEIEVICGTTVTNVVEKPLISVRTKIIGMIKFGKTIAVACSDRRGASTLGYYSTKGRKLSQIDFDDRIMGLAHFFYLPRQYNAVIVALPHEIRVYNEVALVDKIKFDTGGPIKWIKFGDLGREAAALIIGTQAGGLAIKLFRRTSVLEETIDIKPLILAWQYKLNIPKRTKVYMDQTQRERDNPSKMHEMYQRDLVMLRWMTARETAMMTTKALSSVSTSSVEAVDISVDVHGFGPVFRLTVKLACGTKNTLTNMFISFVFDPEMFKFEDVLIPVSVLTPGNFYTYTTIVEAVAPEKGLTDDIKVYLIRDGRPTPIVTAIISMPISEVSLLD